MKKQLRKLYRSWKKNTGDDEEVWVSWREVRDLIEETVIEDRRQEFQDKLKNHMGMVEYQGFQGGFQCATSVWVECFPIIKI